MSSRLVSLSAFRLVKAKYAKSAFSGEGARIAGGRWNLAGTALVYASESLSLAALETFVHLQPVDRSIRYVWFRIEVPVAVRIETVTRLPETWRAEPPGEATQVLGSQWAQQGRTAILKVPSILVPGEYNLLVNPAHPQFRRLKSSPPHAFDFDGRLWKAGPVRRGKRSGS